MVFPICKKKKKKSGKCLPNGVHAFPTHIIIRGNKKKKLIQSYKYFIFKLQKQNKRVDRNVH